MCPTLRYLAFPINWFMDLIKGFLNRWCNSYGRCMVQVWEQRYLGDLAMIVSPCGIDYGYFMVAGTVSIWYRSRSGIFINSWQSWFCMRYCFCHVMLPGICICVVTMKDHIGSCVEINRMWMLLYSVLVQGRSTNKLQSYREILCCSNWALFMFTSWIDL